MSPLEYLGSALDEWPLYLGLLAIFLALHGVLIQRWAVGIYDPLFILLVSNALGWAIVWFMYLSNDIAVVYLLSFCVAQLALYAGMGVGKLLAGRQSPRSVPMDGSSLASLSLIFAAAAHLASTVAIWSVAGIPLFRDSRLGAFLGSGGLGILERLADSSALIALFSAVFLMLQRPRLRRHPAMLAFWLWYLLALTMSGSKGAFLTLVQCVLSVVFVYGGLGLRADRFWGGRSGKWLILAATVFALGVLTLQQDGDIALAGAGLLYRIVSYGDIYIFAYPESTIEALRGENPLVGMFGGFLSTFRLFPQELLHSNLGYQVAGLVFPDLELVVGPNPQHPVFGYHYFGALGFFFSFFLGMLTMVLHARLYFRKQSSFLAGLLAFLLYFSLVSVSIDFEYSMFKVANMIIGLVAIVGPALLLNPRAVLWRREPVQDRSVALPGGAA